MDHVPLTRFDDAEALASAESGWYVDAATGAVEIKTASVSTDRGSTVELVRGGAGR
ncbi:hypothetical protein [Streptomyces sp. V3I7]|uniref:hypothetical protein n=1 Tax=Streptomyces sp. V3I7 TaxID=3042278 RepID=UPI0027849FB6|nr:hypothetical protein [Streptomyces sp. V3I7]MDQ0994037.1 hypothetical protein [Streptomyces sp. V3I7]